MSRLIGPGSGVTVWVRFEDKFAWVYGSVVAVCRMETGSDVAEALGGPSMHIAQKVSHLEENFPVGEAVLCHWWTRDWGHHGGW